MQQRSSFLSRKWKDFTEWDLFGYPIAEKTVPQWPLYAVFGILMTCAVGGAFGYYAVTKVPITKQDTYKNLLILGEGLPTALTPTSIDLRACLSSPYSLDPFTVEIHKSPSTMNLRVNGLIYLRNSTSCQRFVMRMLTMFTIPDPFPLPLASDPNRTIPMRIVWDPSASLLAEKRYIFPHIGHVGVQGTVGEVHFSYGLFTLLPILNSTAIIASSASPVSCPACYDPLLPDFQLLPCPADLSDYPPETCPQLTFTSCATSNANKLLDLLLAYDVISFPEGPFIVGYANMVEQCEAAGTISRVPLWVRF